MQKGSRSMLRRRISNGSRRTRRKQQLPWFHRLGWLHQHRYVHSERLRTVTQSPNTTEECNSDTLLMRFGEKPDDECHRRWNAQGSGWRADVSYTAIGPHEEFHSPMPQNARMTIRPILSFTNPAPNENMPSANTPRMNAGSRIIGKVS